MGELIVVSKKNIRPDYHTVYIGRGSALGNPFSCKKSAHNVIECDTAEESIEKYKEYLAYEIKHKNKEICDCLNTIYTAVKLGTKVQLLCFCKNENGEGLCHGDTIKEIILSKF